MRRRTFLGALGASLLAGPRGLERAWGQTRAPARRLIVFYKPDGTVHRHWRPASEALDFGAGSILEPLTPMAGKLSVIDGLQFAGVANHDRGMLHMLTAGVSPTSFTRGASVDQVVAKGRNDATRFPSLELGVQSSVDEVTMQSRMCFREADAPLPPNDDPRDVYARLFQEVDPAAARRLQRRQSVLDVMRAEIAALRARAGAPERAKLDAHLDALRTMERGLAPDPAPNCERPGLLELDPRQNEHFGAVGRAQMDLAIAALACDMTRVVSLQWSKANSQTVFSWLGQAEAHHTLSHSEDSTEDKVLEYVAAERWYSEQLAYLLGRLDGLPEPAGDGTMLDHSIVLVTSEIGDSRRHQCTDVPVIVAGGGSGWIRTGQWLDTNGAPHGQLLTSICRAMGVEVPQFGDPGPAGGELTGLLT